MLNYETYFVADYVTGEIYYMTHDVHQLALWIIENCTTVDGTIQYMGYTVEVL